MEQYSISFFIGKTGRNILILILLLFATNLYSQSNNTLKDKFISKSGDTVEYLTDLSVDLPGYQDYLDDYDKSPEVKNIELVYPVDSIVSNHILISASDATGRESVYWKNEDRYLEWMIEIPEEGFYNLELDYYPVKGTGMTIQRTISINGAIPFQEGVNLPFFRYWEDSGSTSMNSFGDEIRPGQQEVYSWNTASFIDFNGFYSEPLKIYLTKGKHQIRLSYLDQPIIVGELRIKSINRISGYETYKSKYINQKYDNGESYIKIQGENADLRSDSTLRREVAFDPSVEPFKINHSLLNSMGGWRWRIGNQSMSWRFSVPTEGLYKIPLHILPNYSGGVPINRQIRIDGKVPFSEFLEYRIPYNPKWITHVLCDRNDNPYLVYLEEGEHTISMTNKLGVQKDSVIILQKLSLMVLELNKKIITITGGTPDLNLDYELDKKIPGLIDDFKYLISELNLVVLNLENLSEKSPFIVNLLKMRQKQIQEIIENPFIIARRLNNIFELQTALTTSISFLKEQSLLVDYIAFVPPKGDVIHNNSTFIDRARVSAANFLNSFVKDYDQVSEIKESDINVNSHINVWISLGKEWGEILKKLIDEDFTPKTGIGVNINILPANQMTSNANGASALLLALVSGSAPDVALGVPHTLPVEFAIRDAVTDLSAFRDYKEIASRFAPGSLIPYQYRNKAYALPEVIDFSVMLYRKDILQELGLSLPGTWDDLYRKVIPVLAQNGMSFGYMMPPNDLYGPIRLFSPFLYQENGRYYSEDGKTSALDSDTAYRAFLEWTRLYNVYGCEIQADLYSRFRIGDMPIAVGSYWKYIQIMVAAPELFGRWGIAPVPGKPGENGTINHTAGGNGTSSIIIKGSEKQEESWEFLKWWLSDDIQYRFGKEVESIIGPFARWNSANWKAFERLPMRKSDLAVFKEQLDSFREPRVVLGGYFTGRHLKNAWNDVVLGDENPRDALEKAVKEINKEMVIKQNEYKRRDNGMGINNGE